MAKTKPKSDSRPAPPPPPDSGAPKWARWFVWAVAACAAVLAVWAIGLGLGRPDDVTRLAGLGWGQYAEVIVGNKIRALWHGALMALCASGGVALLLFGRNGKLRRAVPWALVLLVVFDAWLLSRHYVKTMPLSALAENPVVAILKQDTPERRVALLTQDGFYNWWLTYLFPYHGIKTLNITQMPRMPADYKAFLSTVGKNPLRLWQLSAIGSVLAPAQAWANIQRDPVFSKALTEVFSYNVAAVDSQSIEAGFNVYPAIPGRPGQHVVLRFGLPAPRYTLLAGWREAEDEIALQTLASPTEPLFDQALLSPEAATDLPPLGGHGMTGTVTLVNYRPGRVELATRSTVPALLRAAEKHDRDWHATVDGRPEPVRRMDYLFQGLYLESGDHQVILQYQPARTALWGQAVALLLFIGAAVGLFIGWLRKPAALPHAVAPPNGPSA